MVQFQPTKPVRLFPGLRHWANLPGLLGLIAFVAGIIFAAQSSSSLLTTSVTLYSIYLFFAIVCLTTGILVRSKQLRVLFFFAAGFITYGADTAGFARIVTCRENYPSQPTTVTADILTPPTPAGINFSFLAKIQSINGTTTHPLCKKTVVCKATTAPLTGRTVTFSGTISQPRHPTTPHGYNEYARFRAAGIYGTATVHTSNLIATPPSLLRRAAQFVRLQTYTVIARYPVPAQRAIIRAAFLGEKEYLSPEIKTAFKQSGLYHLLALSGLHAALLLGTIYALLFFLPLPKKGKQLFALALLWLYYLFIGPIPSLTRATIMATVLIAASWFQKKNYPLQSLGLAGIIWLTLTPSSLFQPGFQLSFAATFGILTLFPLLQETLPHHPNSAIDLIIRTATPPFFVSLAATITTLPILVYHFASFSLYGLFANIIATTLMALTMILFFVALITTPLFPPLGSAACALSAAVLSLLLSVARFATTLCWSMVTLPAPNPEVLICFTLLMVASITASKPLRKQLLRWGIPLFFTLIPASLLLHRSIKTTSPTPTTYTVPSSFSTK